MSAAVRKRTLLLYGEAAVHFLSVIFLYWISSGNLALCIFEIQLLKARQYELINPWTYNNESHSW